MSRATIDYGIDLGTTNSSIAVLNGTDVLVYKNNEGFEYTSSAVWINKNNKTYVGRQAKDRLEDDPDNAFCEFKLQMGTTLEYVFKRSGTRMKPEDLSAEVLKALKGDVLQRGNESVQSAVITVPAAFELPQCEATKKAAQLAGFSLSPLLQEPVAAALAYGFQSGSDKVFWLVYDLGGGTFDAAVIQVRDLVIQVVNHGGDNHLGGKLIDWEIVEQLLVPALVKEHKLTDFRRGNKKWSGAFGKLKLAAEQAKILVSRDESAPIHFDNLCQNDRGEPVEFEYELQRKDVERLAEPFIVRSINICKKVLMDKRLGVSNIEKVLLVGGPTLTPYLRQRLSDRNEGLGIPLDFSVDPLTVVARGAAIFAGTQRMTETTSQTLTAGQLAIELEYKPVGADVEPLVGGRILAPEGKSLAGFTVEFVNAEAHPPWRSGKIGLAPNGTFITNLWAEKGRSNTFLIEVCDAQGNRCETIPDQLAYTVGLVITDPPMIHSVGVALATGEMLPFCEKGTPLPTRKRNFLRTAVDIKRGQSEAFIKIPVVEGENVNRADRNKIIGELVISGAQIKRDVPAGSEIEVTIEIDQSRLVRTKAYIFILDEEYETVLKLESKGADPGQLRKDVEQEKKRLEEVRKKAQQTGDSKAQQALNRINQERMEHDLDGSLAAAQQDRDAADKCAKRLLDLQQAVDEAEDALVWPALVVEAEEELKNTMDVIRQHGNSNDKQNAAALETETRRAIDSRDTDLLRRKVAELCGLRIRVLREQPGFWVGLLQWLEERKSTMRDPAQAEQLFSQGQRAMNSNDVPALKAAVQQLISLLSTNQQQEMRKGFGSTVL